MIFILCLLNDSISNKRYKLTMSEAADGTIATLSGNRDENQTPSLPNSGLQRYRYAHAHSIVLSAVA
jgi:hypothetical protein